MSKDVEKWLRLVVICQNLTCERVGPGQGKASHRALSVLSGSQFAHPSVAPVGCAAGDDGCAAGDGRHLPALPPCLPAGLSGLPSAGPPGGRPSPPLCTCPSRPARRWAGDGPALHATGTLLLQQTSIPSHQKKGKILVPFAGSLLFTLKFCFFLESKFKITHD